MSAISWYTSLDWLTFTSHEPPRGWGHPEQINSPVRFYRTGLKYPCGTIASYGNPNSSKWLVSMSSKSIEEHGFLDEDGAREFVAERVNVGCEFSRVDMAITAKHDGALTIDTVRNWIKDGQLTGPEHRIGHVKSIVNDHDERGETIYIGDMSTRGKRGIIRVYDKGLERGMSPNLLTRFEIEEKRSTAHHIARQLADGDSLASLIGSRLQFDNETWAMLTNDEIAPERRYTHEKQPDELDNTWIWLIERIAPVLGRKSAFDEHSGEGKYLRAFMSRWTDEHSANLLTLVNKE